MTSLTLYDIVYDIAYNLCIYDIVYDIVCDMTSHSFIQPLLVPSDGASKFQLPCALILERVPCASPLHP